jgi:hypothetical protein
VSGVPPTTLLRTKDSWRRKLRLTKKGELTTAPPDFTGKKNLVIGLLGRDFITPYGRKTIAKRRAARKVAHESRRRNR